MSSNSNFLNSRFYRIKQYFFRTYPLFAKSPLPALTFYALLVAIPLTFVILLLPEEFFIRSSNLLLYLFFGLGMLAFCLATGLFISFTYRTIEYQSLSAFISKAVTLLGIGLIIYFPILAGLVTTSYKIAQFTSQQGIFKETALLNAPIIATYRDQPIDSIPRLDSIFYDLGVAGTAENLVRLSLNRYQGQTPSAPMLDSIQMLVKRYGVNPEDFTMNSPQPDLEAKITAVYTFTGRNFGETLNIFVILLLGVQIILLPFFFVKPKQWGNTMLGAAVVLGGYFYFIAYINFENEKLLGYRIDPYEFLLPLLLVWFFFLLIRVVIRYLKSRKSVEPNWLNSIFLLHFSILLIIGLGVPNILATDGEYLVLTTILMYVLPLLVSLAFMPLYKQFLYAPTKELARKKDERFDSLKTVPVWLRKKLTFLSSDYPVIYAIQPFLALLLILVFGPILISTMPLSFSPASLFEYDEIYFAYTGLIGSWAVYTWGSRLSKFTANYSSLARLLNHMFLIILVSFALIFWCVPTLMWKKAVISNQVDKEELSRDIWNFNQMENFLNDGKSTPATTLRKNYGYYERLNLRWSEQDIQQMIENYDKLTIKYQLTVKNRTAVDTMSLKQDTECALQLLSIYDRARNKLANRLLEKSFYVLSDSIIPHFSVSFFRTGLWAVGIVAMGIFHFLFFYTLPLNRYYMVAGFAISFLIASTPFTEATMKPQTYLFWILFTLSFIGFLGNFFLGNFKWTMINAWVWVSTSMWYAMAWFLHAFVNLDYYLLGLLTPVVFSLLYVVIFYILNRYLFNVPFAKGLPS